MQTPTIPSPVRDTRKPKIKFPPNACDCHAHIFGPPARFKLLPNTHFVPHECLLPDYHRMLRTIGCDRAVLVQSSAYGTDNSGLIEALQSKLFELRGVVVVEEDITDRELEDLHAIGVRGIRINTASPMPGLKLDQASRFAARIKPLGWHLQFFVNFRDTPQVEEQLAKLPINIVIDHFGRIDTAKGLTAPPFQAILRLLQRENCWAKLMGPYIVSNAYPRYPDLVPFAQAMVKAAPDRVLWGTDWPHPIAREKMPDDGDLADMLLDWAPDPTQRRRILVDNPQRLYGF